MKEMLLAALPWVLCGVAAAIICANLGRKNEESNQTPDKRIAIGMALASMFPEKGDDQDA